MRDGKAGLSLVRPGYYLYRKMNDHGRGLARNIIVMLVHSVMFYVQMRSIPMPKRTPVCVRV